MESAPVATTMDYQAIVTRYEKAERAYRHVRPGTPEYKAAKTELAGAGQDLFLAANELGIPLPIVGPSRT